MMGNKSIWHDVDSYFIDKLLPFDPTLEHVLKANREAGIPEIEVSPTQGKLLYLLAKIKGAENVLEIGTLGGYSSIWLARALPEAGKVYTLEINQEYANIAEENIRHAGFQDKVDVIAGKALDTLASLKEKGVPPFDLIFIDADKQNNPHYLKWALNLANSGALIVADNVVRNGEVINEQRTDEQIRGIRRFMDMLENEPLIESTAIQTVGQKGYDGFAIGVVK
nr:O-methyltransferase [Scopulibacillus daqui]